MEGRAKSRRTVKDIGQGWMSYAREHGRKFSEQDSQVSGKFRCSSLVSGQCFQEHYRDRCCHLTSSHSHTFVANVPDRELHTGSGVGVGGWAKPSASVFCPSVPTPSRSLSQSLIPLSLSLLSVCLSPPTFFLSPP